MCHNIWTLNTLDSPSLKSHPRGWLPVESHPRCALTPATWSCNIMTILPAAESLANICFDWKSGPQACVDLTRNGMTWGSNLLWSKTSIRSASKWSVQIWGQLRLYFVEFGSANLSESNPLALWLLSLLFGSFFKGNMALRLNDRKIVKSPLKNCSSTGFEPMCFKFPNIAGFPGYTDKNCKTMAPELIIGQSLHALTCLATRPTWSFSTLKLPFQVGMLHATPTRIQVAGIQLFFFISSSMPLAQHPTCCIGGNKTMSSSRPWLDHSNGTSCGCDQAAKVQKWVATSGSSQIL